MARIPIHPGEILREDLEALGMSAADLSRHIDLPANHVAEILDGHHVITGDTALRLGHYFGTSGDFWLNLQKLYERRLAEHEHGPDIARLPTLDAGRSGRGRGRAPERLRADGGGRKFPLN